MKKTKWVTLISLVTIASICSALIPVHAEKIVSSLYDSSGVILTDDHPAFTQEDLGRNFENYTGPDATRDLPVPYGAKNNNYAKIVGVVLDLKTGSAVAGATVVACEEVSVITGADGRFQILNLPNGTYSWTVLANGYEPASYPNYSIHASEGVIIFTFYVDKDKEINRPATPDSELHGAGQNINEISTRMQGDAPMSAKPTTTLSVRMLYDGVVQTIGRQQYLYTVASTELYPPSFYQDLGMTDSQIQQLYYAQAIAANSFLEYALFAYSNHNNKVYKVCSSSSCCQAYNPTKINQIGINAASICFERLNGYDNVLVILYQPTSSTYRYASTMFFSDCNDEGTDSVANHPYLSAVSCNDITDGHDGHKKGMCQMGAAQMAKENHLFPSILNYYYTGITTTLLRVA